MTTTEITLFSTGEPEPTAEPTVPSVPISNGVMKSHAGLMVIAFLIFIPFGNMVSRHFRLPLSERSPTGFPIWYQLHRSCQIIAVIIATASFILIFVAVNGYAYLPWSPDCAHPILGITAMALLYINLILGLAHVKREQRATLKGYVWLSFHSVVGNFALATGIVAIIVAILMQSMGMPPWCIVFPVLSLVVHVVMNEILTRCKPKYFVHSDESSIAMVDMQDGKTEQEESNAALETEDATQPLNYGTTDKESHSPFSDSNSSIRIGMLIFYGFVTLLLGGSTVICIGVLC